MKMMINRDFRVRWLIYTTYNYFILKLDPAGDFAKFPILPNGSPKFMHYPFEIHFNGNLKITSMIYLFPSSMIIPIPKLAPRFFCIFEFHVLNDMEIPKKMCGSQKIYALGTKLEYI